MDSMKKVMVISLKSSPISSKIKIVFYKISKIIYAGIMKGIYRLWQDM